MYWGACDTGNYYRFRATVLCIPWLLRARTTFYQEHIPIHFASRFEFRITSVHERDIS